MFEKLRINLRRWSRQWRNWRLNREFLVFLVFLLVSVVFWFVQTFKENTSMQIDYELEFVAVPKNVIITSEIPSTVSVTVTGRGFSLIDYLTKGERRKLTVDYSLLQDDGDKVVIDNAVWRRLLMRQLGSAIQFTSVNPSTLDIYYSTGAHKYVPVEWGGRVKVDEQHVLCGIEINPLYVDIYAPEAQFDTITTITTEYVSFPELKDTMFVRLALAPPKGVKCVPDSVDAMICVDLFTTKKLQLPVYSEHVPENLIVRPFPSTVSVTFRVSASLYSEITEKDFALVVDYNNIKPGDKYTPLIMLSQPDGISSVQISPSSVEYIIEQQ